MAPQDNVPKDGMLLNALSYLPKPLFDRIVPEMPIPDVKNDPSKVQLRKISHVYYTHPNLSKFEEFAVDFGLVEAHRIDDTIYYRGYGTDQYVYVASKGRSGFGGACFVAQSQEEFEKAKKIPGGSLTALNDLPGGGEMITFNRPNGTFFHVMFGQQERQLGHDKTPSAIIDTVGPMNTPFEKPRRGRLLLQWPFELFRFSDPFAGEFQRFKDGPALIHKLGHFGYVCKEFDTEFEFYTSNFNFVHSDVLFHPVLKKVDGMTFMHLDLGPVWTDHHCFFMQRAPPSQLGPTYVHHSSFEVEDFDTQLMGHKWLAKKGWKSVWGVGRHILGSQIFDYWADPTGFKVEHYADGDLVNDSTGYRRSEMGPLSVWGPELPKDFGDDGTRGMFFKL